MKKAGPLAFTRITPKTERAKENNTGDATRQASKCVKKTTPNRPKSVDSVADSKKLGCCEEKDPKGAAKKET